MLLKQLGIDKQAYKILMILAIPIIIENVLQILLGTTDMFFAGQLGDLAIAAIGMVNLIVNIIIAFYTAISIGTMAVVARNVGKKDVESVNNTIIQAINTSLMVGMVMGLLSVIFAPNILAFMGVDAQMAKFAIPYYQIVVIPSVLVCLSFVLSSCLRAMKDSKTPMYTTAFGNIVNIILNLIFMKLGLGIVGLALATTIARLVTVILMFIKLMKTQNESKTVIKLKMWSIKAHIIKQILKIGIPAGIERFVMRMGQLLYNNLIITIGITSFVAHNIAGTIESYTYVFGVGFGVATANLVGISLGEHNPHKAIRLTTTAFRLTTFLMVIAGIFIFIFAPQLTSLFTNTPEVHELAITVIRLIAIFQPFAAMTQVYSHALQGAGDTKFPMYATLIGIWVFRIGLGYLFAINLNLGLLGFWIGYVIDLMVRGIALFIRFKQGNWHDIEI